MFNWVFFPEEKKAEKTAVEDFLVMLLTQMPGTPTTQEWNQYIPESKPRMQKASIGFLCGNSSEGKKTFSPVPDLYAGLSEFPVRKLNDQYRLLPEAWNGTRCISIEKSEQTELCVHEVQIPGKTRTVAGMLLLEPVINVYGCRKLLFSKYTVPPLPELYCCIPCLNANPVNRYTFKNQFEEKGAFLLKTP